MSEGRDTLARLAALLEAGQFIPLDPSAGHYARGSQAVQFSARANVPALALGATPEDLDKADAFRAILKVNAAQGAPRLWQVTIGQDLEGPRRSRKFDAVRVRWNCGQLFGEAEMDLPTTAACFPLVADSVELLARNGDPGSDPIKVQASVAPFGGVADWRAPRKSVLVNVLIGPVLVIIPRYAQQMSVSTNDPGPLTWDWQDDAGTLIATGQQLGSFPLPQEIPGNAGQLLIGGGQGHTDVAFVFRLGL